VSIEVESVQFSTFKDQNLVFGSTTYYDIIEEM